MKINTFKASSDEVACARIANSSGDNNKHSSYGELKFRGVDFGSSDELEAKGSRKCLADFKEVFCLRLRKREESMHRGQLHKFMI